MKFGLTDRQYQYIQETVVDPLKNQGAAVWIFGSRARGEHQKFSDLDLMVSSDNDISAHISKIQELLEEENFPFKVDIVESKNFAESYRKNFDRDKMQL